MKSHPHPERPDRLRAIAASLSKAGLWIYCSFIVLVFVFSRLQFLMDGRTTNIVILISILYHIGYFWLLQEYFLENVVLLLQEK